MEDIINLNSRSDSVNTLKKLKRVDGSESKTYVLRTEYNYVRTGEVSGNHKFIDPSGGPMIVEGAFLPEANAKVKSIDYVYGYGHTITFE